MLNLYEELKTLIYAKGNKEIQCRAYLKYAADVLFRDGGVDIVCDAEYRGHSGTSDYIVSGRGHESGSECRRVYLWELKAPQCPLFVKDPSSANRLFPSKELLQAENQLLNYYDELRESADFRSEFEITHPSNVCIGGIIIGSDKTKVKLKAVPTRKASLCEKAYRCRRLFYRSDIRLMLWNTILDQLQPPRMEERI
jgi:hypothetical protein